MVFFSLAVFGMLPLFAETHVDRREIVIYGYKEGVALTLDVYFPSDANGKGAIWVVSRSGRSSRDAIDGQMFGPLLARGYTVFAVVHGSAPRFNIEDMTSDIRLAVGYVSANAESFNIESGRIAIAGASAGGTLALLAGLSDEKTNRGNTKSAVAAIACFFSPTDWLSFGSDGESVIELQRKRAGFVDPAFIFHDYDKSTDRYVDIGNVDRWNEKLKEFSPVTHVSTGDPPTLIIHGDADRAIPFRQAEVLNKELAIKGVKTRLVRKENKGHGWTDWKNDIELVADWFDAHL